MKRSFYLSGLLFCSFMLSFMGARAAGIPTITSNPANDTVCTGSNAKFIIGATITPGTDTITYSWLVSTDGGTTWSAVAAATPYSGTTKDTLTITSSLALSGYKYKGIATHGTASDTSTAAILIVKSPLIAGSITGAAAVCVGSTITLADATAGGVWSSINAHATVGGTTGIVRGVSEGFDSIKYTVSNICGSSVAAVSIRIDTTVTALPITGPSFTCIGHATDLANANVLGTWTWSASNANATVATDGSVSGVNYGVDTISYHFTNACNSVTSTFPINVDTVLNPGVITGAAPLCVGSTVTLVDTIAGGTWSVSNSAASVSGTGLVGGVHQGFDTVIYTVTNICGPISASAPVRVDTTVVSLPITGPTVTCTGHYIDLMNVNVLGTWTWTENTGKASVAHDGAVLGLAFGNDTVTYHFTNTCNSVSSSYAIHIDTPLYAGVISGPTTVCAGSDISLSETVSGGTWLSSNSGIAVVDGSGNVTGVAQGSVTISYFLTNGCGATIATHAVSIDGISAPIAGPDSVGVGYTVTLSDTTAGGTWSSSNTSIATISSTGVVSGLAAGTTTIIYTVTNTCGTTSSSITMNVGTASSPGGITGSDSVCVGSTITLSNATGGGTCSVKNAHATVNNAGVVTGVSYGMDTVYYSVTTGFGTTVASTTVFVNQPPIVTVAGPAIIALGGDYLPVAQPYGGTWSTDTNIVGVIVYSALSNDSTYIDGILYTTVSQASFVVTGGGTETITYTDRNTCGTGSASFTVHLVVVGTPQVNMTTSSLNVYPNPNKGLFVINMSSMTDDKAVLTITNVIGERVKQMEIPTNKDVDIRMDVPAGIYLINAATATGNYSSKVTITK